MPRLLKCLLPCTLLIMIGFCAFFYDAFQQWEESLIQENFAGRRTLVDMMADNLDERVRRGMVWEEDILVHAVSLIDEAKGTYAELFDSRLNSLSPRSPSFHGNPFQIKNHPGVVSQIMMQDRGDAIVPFAKDTASKPHALHLYWRWVPSDKTLENRYVVLLGVSKYSLDAEISNRLIYGTVILLVVTMLNNLGNALLMKLLGHFWLSRKKDKFFWECQE